jgi:twitching motility protein PilT
MRDFETISTALLAAETGHLVMSTLHTLDTTETVNRVISVFPPYQQKQVRLQLASVLRGIVSQRLIPRADGKGRVPAVEVCVATATVRESIVDPDKTRKLPDVIAAGVSQYGMQTFDQSLMGLLKSSLITYEEALRQATNPDDFALRVSGISGTSDSKWDSFEKQSEAGAPPPARPPPVPQPAAPRAPPGPGQAVARIQPAQVAVKPAQPAPGADDDFQIERF